MYAVYIFLFLVLTTFCLGPYAFSPIGLGDIMPSGWLKDQIKVQADGLSGYIDEYWNDVQFSGWIGGWAEGWERFPYMMDGFYPLAVLSKNQRLMSKALGHIDYILAHQDEDGWVGPNPGAGNLGFGLNAVNDPWPSFVFLKALTQVHSHTKNETIFTAALKIATNIDSIISKQGLDPFCWAKYRLQDFVYVLEYMYDFSPSSQLESMISKYAYSGFDWFAHFSNFTDYEQKQDYDPTKDNLCNHGVNNAQAVKFPAVRYRVDQKAETSSLLKDWVSNRLQKFHGTATGLFHGDELYAGTSPTQGSELCLVVEFMFSLELSLQIIGDAWIGDLLEQVAYNNLPSVLDEKMKIHQYVTLDNQVICQSGSVTNFTDVGGNGPLYGVAPDYGCCTANFHQGWPKFVSNLWGLDLQQKLVSGVPAVVLLVHAPSYVSLSDLSLKGITKIELEYETYYPFGNGTGVIKVHSVSYSDDREEKFAICYRMPKFAQKGSESEDWKCESKVWKSGDSVKVELDMEYRVADEFYTYHDSMSLYRGPLLLSKPIEHTDNYREFCPFPQLKESCEDYYDYEKLPTEDWNYALINFDRKNPSKSIIKEVSTKPSTPIPFSREDVPLKVTVKAAKVSDWKLNETYRIAGEVPQSPVKKEKLGQVEDIVLVPIGSTDLRVSVFPTGNV